jgi:3-oxoacyl-[acyl-carrier protein] reductase
MTQEKKVVFVSGGSRGLGEAIVKMFLEKGHTVATFSRNTTPFVETLKDSMHRQRFYWQALDARDHKGISNYLKSLFKQLGKLDVLINNAATGEDGNLALMASDKISQIISLNLESVINLTQICIKLMLMNDSGVIVNISSINAIRGHAGVSVYTAAKAGLDGLTRSLAKELGPKNIRINSIAPGYLDTEMTQNFSAEQRGRIIRRTPLARLGNLEEIVSVVDFLVSSSASFITGQTLVVDGGLTC